MKGLIIGGTGMLGHKLVQTLESSVEVWTTIRRPFAAVERFGIFDRRRTIDELNVKDDAAVRQTIENIRPDVVINAVGVVKQGAVDDLTNEMMALNAELPQRLAEMSKDLGFRLISISTDCVFSGRAGNYREEDPPDAQDIYGRTKLQGEVMIPNCLTLRTSMIGRELDSRHSLVEWLLTNRGGEVSGFVNAVFSGFSTLALARIIASIITDHKSLSGLYHISSEPISKFELLKMIDRHFDAGIRINPETSVSIDRSLDSRRFRGQTGFKPLSWPEMVHEMANDPTPYDTFHEVN